MASLRDNSPRAIDAALSGRPVAPELEALSVWADDVRRSVVEPIADDVATAQIASAVAIAAQSAPATATATRPKASPLHRLRKRFVLSSLLSGMAAKVFAASVALATVTGGVAATGALPDAIQDPLASLYNRVGFDFPSSVDDGCDAADQECTETPAGTVGTPDPDGDDPTVDPGGPDDPTEGVKTGPNNTNGNKSGPNNTNGKKIGPGDGNNGVGPGNNNGKGPGNNNGVGPGENNGNPGENNGGGNGNPGGNNGGGNGNPGGNSGGGNGNSGGAGGGNDGNNQGGGEEG